MSRSSASGHAKRKFEFQHDDTLSKLKNTRRFFIYQYISATKGLPRRLLAYVAQWVELLTSGYWPPYCLVPVWGFQTSVAPQALVTPHHRYHRACFVLWVGLRKAFRGAVPPYSRFEISNFARSQGLSFTLSCTPHRRASRASIPFIPITPRTHPNLCG